MQLDKTAFFLTFVKCYRNYNQIFPVYAYSDILFNIEHVGIYYICIKQNQIQTIMNDAVAKECLTLKVPIAPNYKGVCLQNTSKFHSYLLKIW